jgi:hypothetical protein
VKVLAFDQHPGRLKSPGGPHGIGLDLAVRRQQRQAVGNRLANQHPVEGILVVGR